MTNEKAISIIKNAFSWYEDNARESEEEDWNGQHEALRMAIKALEPKPMEKFDDVKTHIQRLAGDYKCWDNRLTWEEALELNRMFEAQPNSNEFFNFDAPMVKKSDAVSREAVIKTIKEMSNANPSYTHTCDVVDRQDLIDSIDELPPVTPQYTDEEIDKAQAVEQAYVDKMVELAVEEIKERYSDAIGKMKKAIDEMTEIHSDGEFYIKNVDAKWIISKYLCGAELKEASDG